MIRALTLAAVGTMMTFAGMAAAQETIVFPSGTKFITGVPRFDEDDNAWKCRIRCSGLANSEIVVGYQFLYLEGSYLISTGWQADGGEIICNPFQSFKIGLSKFVSPEPTSCQVALK